MLYSVQFYRGEAGQADFKWTFLEWLDYRECKSLGGLGGCNFPKKEGCSGLFTISEWNKADIFKIYLESVCLFWFNLGSTDRSLLLRGKSLWKDVFQLLVHEDGRKFFNKGALLGIC